MSDGSSIRPHVQLGWKDYGSLTLDVVVAWRPGYWDGTNIRRTVVEEQP